MVLNAVVRRDDGQTPEGFKQLSCECRYNVVIHNYLSSQV
jgi:hypothetical protein